MVWGNFAVEGLKAPKARTHASVSNSNMQENYQTAFQSSMKICKFALPLSTALSSTCTHALPLGKKYI